MIRSTRTRIAALVVAVVMLTSVATPAFAATRLSISGSTTLFPLASKWASVYKAAHGWSMSVITGGSGKGITDVTKGSVDIGMSSRMKQSSDNSSLVFTPVARDALVIVINPALQKKYPKYIYRLTPMQVQKIFRGQITRWNQINGHLPNHAIDLCGRTGASGSYTYFKQMFLTNQTATGEIGPISYKQSARTRQYVSNGVVRSSVAHDMYAIGYLSEAYVNSSVKVLNMQTMSHYYDSDYVKHTTPASQVGKWVVPSVKTALNGTYKYVRPLYFVTMGAPSGNAATFINWCKSSSGQAYAPGQHFLKLH